jgi:sugar phosphate isomerase/epimerase
MRGSENSDEEYFRRVCNDANRIADAAAERGVRVAFEFHDGTISDSAEAADKLFAALPHPNVDTLWQPLVSLDSEQRNRSLQVVLPRLAHVHAFHWLPADPIDRRPLAEGADLWRGWLGTMSAAGRNPDCLLEFVHGDLPARLEADALVLSDLLSGSRRG